MVVVLVQNISPLRKRRLAEHLRSFRDFGYAVHANTVVREASRMFSQKRPLITETWVRSFLKRHNFVCRKVTTSRKSWKLSEWNAAAAEFTATCSRIVDTFNLPPEYVFNADCTMLRLGDFGEYTLHPCGAANVGLRTARRMNTWTL